MTALAFADILLAGLPARQFGPTAVNDPHVAVEFARLRFERAWAPRSNLRQFAPDRFETGACRLPVHQTIRQLVQAAFILRLLIEGKHYGTKISVERLELPCCALQIEILSVPADLDPGKVRKIDNTFLPDGPGAWLLRREGNILARPAVQLELKWQLLAKRDAHE